MQPPEREKEQNMKKLVAPTALVLAALMLLTAFVPAAAFGRELFSPQAAISEADWNRNRRDNDRRDWGRDRRPPPPPRRPAPPPPPPRRDHDRDRDRDRGSSGSIAGSIIGSVLSGLISGALNDDDDEPQVYYTQPDVYYVEPAQPVLVCDSFGNCWYE
jgi:hypothetical protein